MDCVCGSSGAACSPLAVEAGVLQGVLSASSGQANLVNARLLAKEQGIIVQVRAVGKAVGH